MSLYAVQKFLYQLNRTPDLQGRYRADRAGAVAGFDRADAVLPGGRLLSEAPAGETVAGAF